MAQAPAGGTPPSTPTTPTTPTATPPAPPTPPSNETDATDMNPWVANWEGTADDLKRGNPKKAADACTALGNSAAWQKYCIDIGMVAECHLTAGSKVSTKGKTNGNATVTCSCSCQHPNNPIAMDDSGNGGVLVAVADLSDSEPIMSILSSEDSSEQSEFTK